MLFFAGKMFGKYFPSRVSTAARCGSMTASFTPWTIPLPRARIINFWPTHDDALPVDLPPLVGLAFFDGHGLNHLVHSGRQSGHPGVNIEVIDTQNVYLVAR